LEGVDLDVPAGGTVAVLGMTGSGKSTLLALVNRLRDAAGGSVEVAGVPVGEVEIGSLRHAVGTATDDNFLFSGTLRENIAFARALPSARRRRRRRRSRTDRAERALSATSEDTAARGRVALLRALLDPYRRRVMAAMTATVLSTAAKLAPPYLAGRVVDDVIQTGSTRTLVLIAIALVVALVLAWLAETAETWLVGDVGQRALMDLRFRLVDHLQTLPMRYYDRASAGRVMSRVTNDVEALNNVVTGGLNQLVSNLLLVVGTVVVLLVLDWRMALVAA